MQELEELVGIEYDDEIVDHTYRPLTLKRRDLVWVVPYLALVLIVSTFTYLTSANVSLGPLVREGTFFCALLVPLVTPLMAVVRRARNQVFALLFGAHLLCIALIAATGYHAAWLARGPNNTVLFIPLLVLSWLVAVSPAALVVVALRALVRLVRS